MTAAAPADLIRRTASHPLPTPPRRSRVLPWALFALLWGLSTGLLIAGSQIAAALGN